MSDDTEWEKNIVLFKKTKNSIFSGRSFRDGETLICKLTYFSNEMIKKYIEIACFERCKVVLIINKYGIFFISRFPDTN